jgi:Skp family chaperone for outer membrane proteins
VRTPWIRKQAVSHQRVVFVIAAVAASSMLGSLHAQAPHPLGANASKYHIAVVDISYIFKKHERFKATMEGMKKEMENIEADLKADRDNITKLEQQKSTLQPGTPDYKRVDEQVARMMADFQLKMGRLRKDFMDREAKVYYQTYKEVVAVVDYYAKRQGIGLVLRFSGEEIDPNRREDVLREINKPVVMQDSIDITGDILALLNRDQQATPQQQFSPQARQPGQLPPR